MTGTIHESCTPALRSRRRLKKLVCQKRLTAYQVQQIRNGKDNALVLGNYVILGTLGQGGMGLVFKAQQRRMERLVALKVLSPKVVQTPESLLRFQREVKAAARLTHPNIVMAYDADEASGTHFLVMEYVDGTDLASLVTQRGPLPLDRTLDFILQAARGLEYAHQHGVIPHLLLLACGVWLLGLARCAPEPAPLGVVVFHAARLARAADPAQCPGCGRALTVPGIQPAPAQATAERDTTTEFNDR